MRQVNCGNCSLVVEIPADCEDHRFFCCRCGRLVWIGDRTSPIRWRGAGSLPSPSIAAPVPNVSGLETADMANTNRPGESDSPNHVSIIVFCCMALILAIVAAFAVEVSLGPQKEKPKSVPIVAPKSSTTNADISGTHSAGQGDVTTKAMADQRPQQVAPPATTRRTEPENRIVATSRQEPRSEQLQGLIRALSDIIHNDPANAVAYEERGNCYQELGRMDLAKSDHDTAESIREQNGRTRTPNNDELSDREARIRAASEKYYQNRAKKLQSPPSGQ